MVHPGIVVAGVLGVVVTGVVIYSILKEEIDDFLQSFEHQKVPVGAGGHGEDQQRQQRSDYNDPTSSSSSGLYHGDYELRQRRPRQDEDEDDNEKDLDVSFCQTAMGNELEEMWLGPQPEYCGGSFLLSEFIPCVHSCICACICQCCAWSNSLSPPPLLPSPFVVSNVMPSFRYNFFPSIPLQAYKMKYQNHSGSRLFFPNQSRT